MGLGVSCVCVCLCVCRAEAEREVCVERVKFAFRRTAASLRDILRCMYNDSLQAEMQVHGGPQHGKQLEHDTAEQMGVDWEGGGEEAVSAGLLTHCVPCMHTGSARKFESSLSSLHF